MKRPISSRILSVVLALVASSMAVGTARAENNQETINRFTVQVQGIESKDSDKLLTTELGLAKAWLGEAQAQLTQEKEEDLGRTVKRISAVIDLMNAKIAKVADERRAAEARKNAAAAQAALVKARAEVQALNQQLNTLTKKLEK